MMHIFLPEQLDEEFKKVIDLVLYVFGSLGFENFAQISLRDKENRENILVQMKTGKKQRMLYQCCCRQRFEILLLNMAKLLSMVQVDFMVKDALGRQWQLGTIQWITTYQNVLI
jgi:threonyl-tRNA synthetase